jgi:hypothetical protein
MFGHSHEPFSKIIDCDKFVVTNDGQSLYHNFYQFTSTSLTKFSNNKSEQVACVRFRWYKLGLY